MKRCTRDDVYSFITKAGLEGRTFGEIQRFVVEKNGRDYDSFAPTSSYVDKTGKSRQIWKRTNRGYWCTNLLGCNYGYHGRRVGILESATVKVGKRYVSKVYADMV